MENNTLAVRSIEVRGQIVPVAFEDEKDGYILLTGLARFVKGRPCNTVTRWVNRVTTVEFLEEWEGQHNMNFNRVAAEKIKEELQTHSRNFSVKRWIDEANAIGLRLNCGHISGTFAHYNIAVSFMASLSKELAAELLVAYQCLVTNETAPPLDWKKNREDTKNDYRVHTDAIRANLATPELPGHIKKFIYATEADALNVAMFGHTAQQWRELHPVLKGSIRDYATPQQLFALTILESLNADMIKHGISLDIRLKALSLIASEQMACLCGDTSLQAQDANFASEDEA